MARGSKVPKLDMSSEGWEMADKNLSRAWGKLGTDHKEKCFQQCAFWDNGNCLVSGENVVPGFSPCPHLESVRKQLNQNEVARYVRQTCPWLKRTPADAVDSGIGGIERDSS